MRSRTHTAGGDFRYVTPTAAEIDAWRAAEVRRHGVSPERAANLRPRTHRVECVDCGARIWGSGIGIGSHRRACPGPSTPTAD